jgi:VIT1/CCC1 family predicted Fe2+/Mn2+ transporter
MGPLGRLKASFRASVGDVVFGMEDGTVSIFGLVFGMALSAPDSQAVLLAGATGAAAAAVSMMAGAYLDAKTQADAARARAATPVALRDAEDAAAATRIAARLSAAGAPLPQVEALRRALSTTPGALAAIRAEVAPAGATGASPASHAAWMFVADLFAGAVPVLPFALLPLEQARIASVAVTTVLLVALGIGRGLVGQRGIARATAETLLVAAAAAAAGVAIGRLVA